MLAFGVFEADSGYEEVGERLSKFNEFNEITIIEDNFPFQLCDSKLFSKLINDAEVVFEPYSSQVHTTLSTLKDSMAEDETQVLQSGDLLFTQHSNLPLVKSVATGLVSQKDFTKCRVFVDVFSKFLKACFNFYIDQLDVIFVPLDFLVTYASKLTAVKV